MHDADDGRRRRHARAREIAVDSGGRISARARGVGTPLAANGATAAALARAADVIQSTFATYCPRSPVAATDPQRKRDSGTMASILLVGTDEALLEGLAQTLSAAGHRAERTTSLAEATRRAADEPPLVVVAERALAVAGARGAADLRRVSLAPGGAVVLFRASPAAAPSGDDAAGAASGSGGGGGESAATNASAAASLAPLPPALQRAALAELALPLERHRLVALVQHVEERARRTGRSKASPSEPERITGGR